MNNISKGLLAAPLSVLQRGPTAKQAGVSLRVINDQDFCFHMTNVLPVLLGRQFFFNRTHSRHADSPPRHARR